MNPPHLRTSRARARYVESVLEARQRDLPLTKEQLRAYALKLQARITPPAPIRRSLVRLNPS